jgi:hypothetical protein
MMVTQKLMKSNILLRGRPNDTVKKPETPVPVMKC